MSDKHEYPEIGGWPITRKAYKMDPYIALDEVFRRHAPPFQNILIEGFMIRVFNESDLGSCWDCEGGYATEREGLCYFHPFRGICRYCRYLREGYEINQYDWYIRDLTQKAELCWEQFEDILKRGAGAT